MEFLHKYEAANRAAGMGGAAEDRKAESYLVYRVLGKYPEAWEAIREAFRMEAVAQSERGGEGCSRCRGKVIQG